MRILPILLGMTLAAGAAPVSIDELMRFQGAGQPAISPDGSRVAYVTGGAVWTADVAGGQSRKLHDGASPAWSPDGARIALLLKGQLWIVPLEGQAARLTTGEQKADRFQWSPDGKKIAFLTPAPSLKKPGAPTVVDVNDLPRNQIMVVDAATRAVTSATSPEYSALGYEQWFPDGFSWSPDSRRIAFTWRPHAKAGSHHQGDLAVVNADGTRLEVLARRPGYDGNPRWSPDGRQLAFISTGRYDWVRISNLLTLDLASRQVRNLSREFDESVKEFHWTLDGSRLYFVAGQGVSTQVFVADARQGAVRQVSQGQDVIGELSITPDGKRCAFIRQNAAGPPEVYVSELGEWKPRILTRVAMEQTKNWVALETEIVRWKSFDGMEIEGVVHKPAGYERGRRYPLLVVPHGGPHGVQTNVFPLGNTRLFGERGWVVFRPNFRGSGNYGERFLRANLYGWGLGDYQDIMTGADHLIAVGLVDGERMAISGSSYGGYMTSWVISQTNRFKAAVAGCGITDVPSFLRTTDVPDRFEDYLGADDRSYARHSPMTYGTNIRTPTLIWHGDLDERVPLMQSRHLYTQLLKNKVSTEFVIYHGEAHGARRADVRRDLIEREWRWITSLVK